MWPHSDSFSPLRKNVSVRHETPIEGKVVQSQEHCKLLGHYVKGVPAFQLLTTWLRIKLLLPFAIPDKRRNWRFLQLCNTLCLRLAHSYHAQILEIVVNNVDSFRNDRGQRPSTKMIRQKAGNVWNVPLLEPNKTGILPHNTRHAHNCKT
jgi:hypothetical protein